MTPFCYSSEPRTQAPMFLEDFIKDRLMDVDAFGGLNLFYFGAWFENFSGVILQFNCGSVCADI